MSSPKAAIFAEFSGEKHISCIFVRLRVNRKFDIIRAIARKYNFSLYDPIDALPDEAVSLLVFGSEDLFRVGEGWPAGAL